MYIFNTTYLVSDKRYSEWIKWLHRQHIPSMLNSGYFTNPQLARVLINEPQEGTSYSVQFHAKDMQLIQEWSTKYSDKFLGEFSRLFGEEVLLFTTILEVLEC